MVEPMPQPPALTAEQRQAALQKAAKVRRERAEVKEKLKLGSLTLAELLKQAEGDETVGKMKVLSVLESLAGPRQGQGPPSDGDGGISESRRLQGSGRQATRRPADVPPLAEASRRVTPLHAEPLTFVLIGPGGAGKGTVAQSDSSPTTPRCGSAARGRHATRDR